MPRQHLNASHSDLPVQRPVCPSCGVEMWLVRLETSVSDATHLFASHVTPHYRFKCEVCDTQALIPEL